MSTIKNIRTSVTNNSLSMIFLLQLSTDFQNIFRIKWKINIITITPCLRNDDVTSCPTWRQKISEIYLRFKSKYLWPLRQHRPIVTAIHLQMCRIRINKALVSYLTASRKARKTPSIYFSALLRDVQELWNAWAHIDCIYHKIALDAGPTSNPSSKDW